MILSTHMAELRAAPTPASTAGLHLQPLPGLVWAFRLDADGTAKELAVDQPMAVMPAGCGCISTSPTPVLASYCGPSPIFPPRPGSSSLPPTSISSGM